MEPENQLYFPHGQFRQLATFRMARLIYDLTVWFCNAFINKRSRTHDQMVQAARSGVQNIAEGNQMGATSKKMEMKLTGVARASLEELRLDYEDFLRQRGHLPWSPDHPALRRFRALRIATFASFMEWLHRENERGDHRSPASRTKLARPEQKHPPHQAILAANGILSLLNLCCYWLDRQLQAQARSFERDGGFTERLYKYRRRFKKKD